MLVLVLMLSIVYIELVFACCIVVHKYQCRSEAASVHADGEKSSYTYHC
jgi:hypothetical protein